MLITPRLILRRWRQSDRAPSAAMNADPRVAEFLHVVMSPEDNDALVDRIDQHFEEHGYGVWAIEVPGVTDFAGFVGLARPTWEASFTPCVEVAWRLAFEHWGHGYVTEGAQAALKFGFEVLGEHQIFSWTVPDNLRSRAVMERLGMAHDPADDFDHPRFPDGHRLRRHVRYRLQNPRVTQSPPGIPGAPATFSISVGPRRVNPPGRT